MCVDELAAVVRVDAQDGEGELGNDVLEGLEHPDGRLVLDRAVDRPARGDVGDREGETELAARVAPFVADQVDFDEPGRVLVPLGPGAYRDLGLEQRPGLGVGASPGHELARSGARCRSMDAALMDTSRAASSSLRAISPSRRKRGTTVASMGARRLPAGARVSIQHVARPAITCGANFEARAARGRHDLEGPGVAEGRSGVVAVPPRELDQLVEDPRLLGPGGPFVGRRLLLGDGLALAHRKLHHEGVIRARHRRSGITASKRRFLGEATYGATRRFLMSQCVPSVLRGCDH